MSTRLPSRPALAACLILVITAVAAFAPALFQGKIVAPLDITRTLLAPWNEAAAGEKPHNHFTSDAVIQYLPYRFHAAESLREDGYIGWNPYTMGGSSLAANTMALPATWTMQLHRFLPFSSAWNTGLLAEFIIAGLGMLAFLRGRNLPWTSCVLGALVYMGNSQFIIWIHHRWALGSFSWMPWVLWAATDLRGRTPSPRHLTLPLFLSLAILGGSLQHMVFVGLACACFALGGIPDLRRPSRELPAIASWAAAFVLALTITAFTLVPQVSGYLTNLQIGNLRGGLGYPEGLTQPFFNLLAIPAQIWPWLMGDPQSLDGWRLLKSGFMNLAYLGTIPMMLGIAGLFFPKMPRQAKFLVAAGLLIPLTPLVGPLYHRVQLLFILGAAWMAAEMIASFSQNPPKRLIRAWTFAVIAIGAGLLLASALPSSLRTSIENKVVSKSLAASGDSQFGADSSWIETRARRWVSRFALHDPRTAWTYGLLLLGTAGLHLAASSHSERRRWGTIAITCGASLELFTLFQTWVTFSDPNDFTPPHPAIDTIRTMAGNHRVYQGFGRTTLGGSFAAPNLLAAYQIPVVDAYESIQYRSTSQQLRNMDPAQRLSLAGVAVSVQPQGSPAYPGTSTWQLTPGVHGSDIRQNPSPISPLTSGSGSIPPSVDGLADSLNKASAFSPESHTMNHWSFSWPAGADWIRISQNWHSGWKWRTPGSAWQPVAPGPDSACWIQKPGPDPLGKIELRFFPRPAWLSAVSLTAALVCIAALIFSAKLSETSARQ